MRVYVFGHFSSVGCRKTELVPTKKQAGFRGCFHKCCKGYVIFPYINLPQCYFVYHKPHII